MPTGYTAGIIDGSIKDFKEYAVLCTRAFGAAIHERDEKFSKDAVKKREPSSYYIDAIKGLNKEKEKLNMISDEDLINERKEVIEEDIRRYKECINKAMESKSKLIAMRTEVEAWNPPTEEHNRYKEFMLEQLDMTIKSDCDTTYYEGELAKSAQKLLDGFDPKKERERRRLAVEQQLEYHTKNHIEEVLKCDNANEWLDAIYRTL